MPGKGRTRTLEVLRERETERICEERTRKSSSLEREALLLSVNTVVSKKDKQYAYTKRSIGRTTWWKSVSRTMSIVCRFATTRTRSAMRKPTSTPI